MGETGQRDPVLVHSGVEEGDAAVGLRYGAAGEARQAVWSAGSGSQRHLVFGPAEQDPVEVACPQCWSEKAIPFGLCW